MYREISFSRQEVLDLVWSKPLQKVAEEIGVSDVALGKACKKCNVPKPPQGYWLKRESSRPLKPKLGPARSEPYYAELHFQVLDRKLFEVEGALEAEAPDRVVPEIVVKDSLARPHALIVISKAQLEKKTQDGRAIWGEGSLDLRVSRESSDRALRIMDALIKASECCRDLWMSDDKGTKVVCEGSPIRVRLAERFTKNDLPRPVAKRGRRGETEFEPYWPRYEWVGTNEFAFHVEEHTLTPTRNVWKDTSTGNLESKLADIVSTLPKIARAIQAKEAMWKAQRAKWEAAELAAKKEAERVEARRQLRALLANRGAGCTDSSRHGRATQHRRRTRGADVGARGEQRDMTWVGVLAAQLQAVIDGFQAGGVARRALVDAGGHRWVVVSRCMVRHGCFLALLGPFVGGP